MAAVVGGFAGDKHVRTTFLTFHIVGIPGVNSASIMAKYEITICCVIN